MTIANALKESGIDRLETEVLLCALLGRNRTWLIAHDTAALSMDEERRWIAWIERRRGGEPVAYIIGEREFYGRTFGTDPRALIPRPCTESLIAIALDVLEDGKNRERTIDNGILGIARIHGRMDDVRTIVDIGTGTGCIGITMALERPNLRVILTDVSADALALANENAKNLRATVEVRHGDALAPVADLTEPFLIISNPPYIPETDSLPRDVEHFEPRTALRAGPDGGTILRRIITQAREHPQCRGVIVECLDEQKLLI